MKKVFLQDILSLLDGEIVKGTGNTLINNVVTNQIRIKSNTLFFHLKTKKNQNISSKLFLNKKNYIIVTETPDIFMNISEHSIVVEVNNIEQSYWNFIGYYRSLFQIPIIGITGTCGKTTTKEMIHHILSTQYNVFSTYSSDNALSLNLHYLLSLDDETQVAVIEMGVDSPGNLAKSCRFFQPQIRILLNIGVYHLTGCKTPEIYQKAKEEILEGLDTINGTIILNADDENIKKIDISKIQNIIYFGITGEADFKAQNVRYVKDGMAFTLKYKNRGYQAYVPGYGIHNVYNALAAIAAATMVGIDIRRACTSLSTFKQVTSHLEVFSGKDGSIIIDDTWNNSPPSMTAALQVLKDISNTRKTIAVLGSMPRLGEQVYAIEQYGMIGEKVVETDVDLLIVVGQQAEEIGNKAIELGMDKNKVYISNSGTEIYEIILPYLNDQSIILLKIPHRIMIEPSFEELKNKIFMK